MHNTRHESSNEYYTTTNLCDILGISYAQFYNLVNTLKLKPISSRISRAGFPYKLWDKSVELVISLFGAVIRDGDNGCLHLFNDCNIPKVKDIITIKSPEELRKIAISNAIKDIEGMILKQMYDGLDSLDSDNHSVVEYLSVFDEVVQALKNSGYTITEDIVGDEKDIKHRRIILSWPTTKCDKCGK